MIHVERILYPTDFSSYANQAYFHAVGLAQKHGASLTIAFVYDPARIETPTGAGDPLAYWRAQLEQIRPLDEAIPVKHVLLEGEASAEIVRYAREARMSLVVMGTHGRTLIERGVLGSVAERVLRHAPCSVMVVKIPKAG
ncbi:MAG: universal stress protein [Gemmataceae bacterium]|nr:universal stress protein [Gemmataceae bacterium]